MKKLKPLKVYDPETVMSSDEMKRIVGGGYKGTGYLHVHASVYTM